MTQAPRDKPRPGSRQSLLLRLERFSRQRYGVVFLLALTLAALGAWLGTRLRLDSDILALIPAGNRQVDTFKEAVEDFGSVSYLIVLLQAGPEQGPDELEDFADLFAEKLEGLDELIERIEYRFQPDDEFLELFYANALLFLPPERLDELAAKLDDEAILRRMAENRLSLTSPTASFTEELMVNDPLGLMPLFFSRMPGNRGVLRVDLTDGYYLSRDGTSLIMLIKPDFAWQDLAYDHRLLAEVRQVEQDVRRVLTDEGASTEGLEVDYGGHYAMAVDEAKLIREDIRFNIFFSLFAVSALYFICYRRFAALLYSSVPLLVGQAMTFGLAFFVLHSLNASSSAFTALLMGLGTDFVIVMYARYVEERQHGRPLGEATELMVGETGLGVFTGAITSAGTFYAMCISEFRGLRDLGFLIGSGILLCAVAIVFLVPAMIKWNEGVRPRKVDSVKKLHVQSFMLEYLIPFSARHRVLVLSVIGAVTVAAALLATRLEFDDSIQVLRSNRSPAYQLQQRIADEFGASMSYMMAIVEAPSVDEALELTEQVERRLQPFIDDGVVASVDSVLSYRPSDAQQQSVLQAVRQDHSGAFDAQRIRETFLRALDENSFRPEAFEPFLNRMGSFLSPQRPLRLEDLEAHGMGHVVRRYVLREDAGTRVVTYLSLNDPRWKREPPPGMVDALTSGDPRIVITGTNVVNREFRRIFSKEAPRAVLLGLVVVFVLLLVDFRSLRLTSIALAQLICGVIIMLGMMKLAGVRLNYVNAFVATMILGVGIDYSIHLVHRMSLSGGKVEAGLLETGKAVVIAALTNVAAFGTLTLGNYPALRSFGTVALFGSLSCLLTALTLVPAIMARSSETELPMLWVALLLGVVEGLTEFLPVSSTGHLILTSALLEFEGPRAEVFEICIQLGAILAVVWEYRSRLGRVVAALPRSAAARGFAGKIALAFAPSALLGLLAHDTLTRNLFFPATVAAALIVGGGLILLVEALPLRHDTHEAEALSWRQALGVGLAQCLALWPGFSRSAATILGGLASGMDRRSATEFSFFLAIPTMFAAAGYKLLRSWHWLSANDLFWLAIAFVVSFVVAWASIRWLLRFVSGHSFRPFAYYRIALGLVILLVLNGTHP